MDVASGRRDPVISVRESMRCRHCGTPLQHTLIDLGMSPLCESFLTQDQLDAPESYYPLHARVCHACWLVQLPEFVSLGSNDDYVVGSGPCDAHVIGQRQDSSDRRRRQHIAQQSTHMSAPGPDAK